MHLISNGYETSDPSEVNRADLDEYNAPKSDSAPDPVQDAPGNSVALILSKPGNNDGLTEEEIQNIDKQIEQALDPDKGIQALEVWQDLNSSL